MAERCRTVVILNPANPISDEIVVTELERRRRDVMLDPLQKTVLYNAKTPGRPPRSILRLIAGAVARQAWPPRFFWPAAAPRTLGPWLRRFLSEFIVTERNLARNTQKSYRDTFALLLPFLGSKVRKPVERLAVRDLTSTRVLQFLAHLEDDRSCSGRTRNQRLAAIRHSPWILGAYLRSFVKASVRSSFR